MSAGLCIHYLVVKIALNIRGKSDLTIGQNHIGQSHIEQNHIGNKCQNQDKCQNLPMASEQGVYLFEGVIRRLWKGSLTVL